MQFISSNLYEVLEKKNDFICLKLSDKNHPIFKAHFPNNPLLPGFILLDICEKEFNHKIKTLKKANFLKPILPEKTISFHLTEKNHLFNLKIMGDQEILANIIYGAF